MRAGPVWDGDALRFDSSGMLAKVASMPDQLRVGVDLAEKAWEALATTRPTMIAVAGMGGSAIGGELLRTYLLHEASIPIVVCRDYRLPRFVGRGGLVVISSYSGNTEEALSCFDDAIARRTLVACIGSGGNLLSKAATHSVPSLRLPAGYPPRAALGYSFSALLGLAWSLDIAKPRKADLGECIGVLNDLNESYGPGDAVGNEAISIAEGLVGSIPVIYCGSPLSAVALRWKNQFCENSKTLAFTSELPELTHNDIMGWETGRIGVKAGVVMLRTSDEHPRVSSRFCFIKDVIGEKAVFLTEARSSGSSLLSRLFSLILLGDYVSVYLALLRGLDPTPIATIENLKSWMRKEQVES